MFSVKWNGTEILWIRGLCARSTGKEIMHDEIMRRIAELDVDCPDCENMEDDQYQCTTCSGGGRINALEYIKLNT